jgi:hypothetical protein
VRIRVLLLYPYSTSGIRRIQAELATNRSAIDEPRFRRKFNEFLNQVTDDSLVGSSLFQTALRTAGVVDNIRAQLGSRHKVFRSPNRFEVRFACINPMVCGLRINARFFYDAYTYAKKSRFNATCPGDTLPLLELEAGDPGYEAFCDHMRYLWSHDSTLDFDDALVRDRGALRFRRPSEVLCESRVGREAQRHKPSKEARHAFVVKAQRIVRRHCAPPSPTTAAEIAFVACAWRKQGGARHPTPNDDAQVLHKALQQLFGSVEAGEPKLGVRMVMAHPGADLATVLYGALQDSTIGIVVLCAEVKTSNGWICTPNVYHELGYLLATLRHERTFIFRDKDVKMLTNVGNLVWIEYEKGKLATKVFELLEGLAKAGVLSRDEAVDAAKSYLASIKGTLPRGERSRIDEFIDDRLATLRHAAPSPASGPAAHRN